VASVHFVLLIALMELALFPWPLHMTVQKSLLPNNVFIAAVLELLGRSTTTPHAPPAGDAKLSYDTPVAVSVVTVGPMVEV
jgi:hypothetical protein